MARIFLFFARWSSLKLKNVFGRVFVSLSLFLFFVFVSHLVFLDSLEAWRWLQDGNLDGVVNRKGRGREGGGEREEK